jgi:hypothetical protein
MGQDNTVPASPLCFVLEPVPSDHDWESDYQFDLDVGSSQNQPVTAPGESEEHRLWTPASARDPDTEVLDTYFNELIEPTLGGHEFRIVRSTGINHKGMVTRQHLNLAESADLMIANISSYDPVAFYCIAHRMGRIGEDNKRYKTIFLRHASSAHLLDLLGQDTIPFGVPHGHGGKPVSIDKAQTESDATRRMQDARRSLTRSVAKFFDSRRRRMEERLNRMDHRGTKTPQEPGCGPDGNAAQTSSSGLGVDLDDLAKSFTEKVRAELKRDMTSVVRDVTRRYYFTEKL